MLKVIDRRRLESLSGPRARPRLLDGPLDGSSVQDGDRFIVPTGLLRLQLSGLLRLATICLYSAMLIHLRLKYSGAYYKRKAGATGPLTVAFSCCSCRPFLSDSSGNVTRDSYDRSH